MSHQAAAQKLRPLPTQIVNQSLKYSALLTNFNQKQVFNQNEGKEKERDNRQYLSQIIITNTSGLLHMQLRCSPSQSF